MGTACRFIQIKNHLPEVTYLKENSSNFFPLKEASTPINHKEYPIAPGASKVKKRRHGTPPRRQKLSPDALMLQASTLINHKEYPIASGASKVRKRRHGTPPRRQKLSPDTLMRRPPGE
ncbi:hypothetical protein CDAR_244821 [Caerostris darwini]|uniref:Uncharacterized protein n=1 Tax=Caerostris darwini TaxID=1538125 RepID=A0AAV4U937_9ARAC|nr:hypothetical protein CDAR_244821 [Caerostris darwini]